MKRISVRALGFAGYFFAVLLLPSPRVISAPLHRICFNPGDCCKSNVIELCDRARASIDIVMYRFTDRDIYVAILNAIERGVHVTLIIDEGDIRDKSAPSFGIVNDLIANGCLVYTSSKGNTLHHKFAVFDRKALITGSFNWTYQGSKNHEDCVLIDDDDVVNEYNRYLQGMFSRGDLIRLSKE